ncbi:MAG: dihydropteroate synthase [Pelagibacteraceae bacterium]|nr:dihydropteroate synthase [Pelagibacteraceae bacterium]
MNRYYTRVCNFYYGKESKLLVNKKKTLPLNGNNQISFDRVEIISKNFKKIIPIKKINKLPKYLKKKVSEEIKLISSKKKNFGKLKLNKLPNIMGVINLTPDSFSDGGKFNKKNLGYKHALSLVKTGAKILDIGGESTRPGSKPISSKIEWLRINKTLKKLVKKNIVSLDSRKSDIIEKGIKLGVNIINDVSGLSFDDNTINILKKYNIPFVLQHTKGTPQFMQKNPNYKNVILEIYDYFEKKIKLLRNIGIKHNKIIIDPGIGFGKSVKHNVQILKNISIFHSLGFPILLGISRKRFIKDLAGINDSKFRLGGTVSSSIFAIMQGVQILRVHDVNEVNQAIKVFKKLINL